MEKLGKKLKHDHTLTSILKFTIFAMVMLAPIFSVASRCLYVICNKNAKDSYSSAYVQSINKVNTPSTLTEGLNYFLKYNNEDGSTGLKIHYSSINVDWTQYGASSQYTYTRFYISKSGNNTQIYLYETDSAPIQTLSNIWGYTLNEIYFTASTNTNNVNTGPYYLYTITYKQQTLDNAFEYSLSQLEESSYYNWATNLGIFTPIHNMVSGLGGHDIIALLLAYWSIYTAIYIVFDIIIVCFVKITHMIQGE